MEVYLTYNIDDMELEYVNYTQDKLTDRYTGKVFRPCGTVISVMADLDSAILFGFRREFVYKVRQIGLTDNVPPYKEGWST